MRLHSKLRPLPSFQEVHESALAAFLFLVKQPCGFSLDDLSRHLKAAMDDTTDDDHGPLSKFQECT